MGEAVHVSHGFEPVFDAQSRVLILGSFPSVLSRANDFYYGNPQNRFWRVMAQVLGESVPQTISQKQELLLIHGIALWDVIESCDIEGSSDASIRNVAPIDIARIVRPPSADPNTGHQQKAPIEAVFCNGGTAARLYRKHLEPTTHLPATTLPSTSPANAAWSLERLVDRWRTELAPYCH